MADSVEEGTHGMWLTTFNRRTICTLPAVMGLAVLPLVAGCSGCRSANDFSDATAREGRPEESPAEKPRAEKPPVEVGRPQSLPIPMSASNGSRPPGLWVKPGHWTAVRVPAVAHHQDLLGRLAIGTITPADDRVPLAATDYTLAVGRLVALPKAPEQDLPRSASAGWKNLRSATMVPPSSDRSRAMVRVSTARGIPLLETPELLRVAPSHQYGFVVLARRPRLYDYLRTLPSIQPPEDELMGLALGADYRLVPLAATRPIDLPATAQRWSSIAYFLWDDLPADLLSGEQQQALLDWLHFGGRLIVSGPRTLELLRGSFLQPYLPARAVGSRRLEREGLSPLGRWRRPDGTIVPSPARPIDAVRLRLADTSHCRFLPDTGELFAERRVGRGRVVTSAVGLGDRGLTRWDGWDGVVNACLLRRPARQFFVDEQGSPAARWLDTARFPEARDARVNCGLRYFASDSGVPYSLQAADILWQRDALGFRDSPFDSRLDAQSAANPLAEPSAGGVAAWRDFGPVPDAARRALRAAAGVEVPPSRFVAWVVGVYLLVLVPVNWSVFRLLDRPHWAWGAAPVISLAAAGMVVYLAQLNIGFVRSTAEAVVVEMQPGSARAHATRYLALYSSLTTRYEFRLDDPGGAALPMPTVARADRFQRRSGQPRVVDYTPGREPTMEGFSVPSNSTGMVHAEHLIDTGGPIELIEDESGDVAVTIRNRSTFPLREAMVIERRSATHVAVGWIGELDADERRTVALVERASTRAIDSYRATKQPGAASTAGGNAAPSDTRRGRAHLGDVDLSAVYRLGIMPDDLELGEIRLVALSDHAPPGLVIEPAADQRKAATLVVAHLRYLFGESPASDRHEVDELVWAAPPFSDFPPPVVDNNSFETDR